MSGRDVLTRSEARTRARLLSDVAYEVTLDLDRGPEAFASTTVLRFCCAEPGAATFVDLEAVTVERATLNGRALGSGAFADARLRLEDLQAANELVVEATCAYSRSGVGLHRFVDPVDGEVYLHTQFQPFDAHRVYACFDQPDLKGAFTLTVDAPAGWVVVSNGRSRRDGTTWRFATTPPIPPYVTAVVAGPLHHVRDTWHGIDLGIYCRRSLAEHLDSGEIFELTRQGLAFYTRLFDHAYPFAKYDQLFVPEFNFGAMENAGCVTFDEAFIFRSKVTEANRLMRANMILHEMAHMWFGNLVTMRWWDDLWLNESFATYMASLALAEATRFRPRAWAEFAHLYKSWAYAEDQRPTTHPVVADVTDTAVARTHFDGITYAKGAAVLKQLAHWVGRDAFVRGVRSYFAERAFATAELADFLEHLERASGRDLRAWARQWLETAGVAALRVETRAGADGRYTAVAVVQEPPADHPTHRDHRVALGLYEATGEGVTRRQRVELDVRGARTEVAELVGAAAGDLLLVNDDDLAYAKVRLDRRSVDTLTETLGRIAAPLARTLCWGALWDMTRDAELPASRWVRLVATHAAHEDDIGVLQTLLRRAALAADDYCAPAHRLQARALLAATAQGALETAKRGSDEQLVWARRLITTAQDPAFARGLLDGTAEVPGLAVDPELRWVIVIRLAALGVAGEEEIAAEVRRDPTDIGIRRAWTARASRPDAEAKDTAFTAVLDGAAGGEPLPLATQRAVLDGFWQADQADLLAAYAAHRWVDALERVWSERGIDEAVDLTAAFYPASQVGDAVVVAADRALADGLLPEAGRRVVVEHRDDTCRALRAQAADAAAEAAGEPWTASTGAQ